MGMPQQHEAVAQQLGIVAASPAEMEPDSHQLWPAAHDAIVPIQLDHKSGQVKLRRRPNPLLRSQRIHYKLN